MEQKKKYSEIRRSLKKHFEVDDVGWMDEYVGCKVEINRNDTTMKITQPVLLQSFEDEFQLPNQTYDTPAIPGQVLQQSEDSDVLGEEDQTKYRSGVGKLLHLMIWSRPEIWNAVRELTKHNGKCNSQHMKAMHRVMKYCVSAPNRG